MSKIAACVLFSILTSKLDHGAMEESHLVRWIVCSFTLCGQLGAKLTWESYGTVMLNGKRKTSCWMQSDALVNVLLGNLGSLGIHVDWDFTCQTLLQTKYTPILYWLSDVLDKIKSNPASELFWWNKGDPHNNMQVVLLWLLGTKLYVSSVYVLLQAVI